MCKTARHGILRRLHVDDDDDLIYATSIHVSTHLWECLAYVKAKRKLWF